MGGGKGGEAFVPEEVEGLVELLASISQGQVEAGLPALQEGANIASELLQGRIPAALRPVVTAAGEQARAAGSETVRQTEEQAARLGLTGTQLQELLADARFSAEANAAQAPLTPIAQALQGATGSTFALPAQGLAGLSQAGQTLGEATRLTPERGGAGGAIGGALTGAATAAPLLGTPVGIPALAAGALLGGISGAK